MKTNTLSSHGLLWWGRLPFLSSDRRVLLGPPLAFDDIEPIPTYHGVWFSRGDSVWPCSEALGLEWEAVFSPHPLP